MLTSLCLRCPICSLPHSGAYICALNGSDVRWAPQPCAYNEAYCYSTTNICTVIRTVIRRFRRVSCSNATALLCPDILADDGHADIFPHGSPPADLRANGRSYICTYHSCPDDGLAYGAAKWATVHRADEEPDAPALHFAHPDAVFGMADRPANHGTVT